jgi:hypothetical protein
MTKVLSLPMIRVLLLTSEKPTTFIGMYFSMDKARVSECMWRITSSPHSLNQSPIHNNTKHCNVCGAYKCAGILKKELSNQKERDRLTLCEFKKEFCRVLKKERLFGYMS